MRNYYIFSNGALKRKENTIFFETPEGDKPIPVENIDQLFVFGEVDFNNKFLNFSAQNGICIHIFNYYGYYSGTFYPRETNLSGDIIVRQVDHYLDKKKRLNLSQCFVRGAVHNIKRNLQKREDFEKEISQIEKFEKEIDNAKNITELMSLEAHVRKIYYSCFEKITSGWEFGERIVNPPGNPLNALISFGNALVYTTILKEIYLTPLNPTISYLHEPGTRRFSLSLDVSEIFKPILVDRIIFKLINLNQINQEHFEQELGGVYLNEIGRKIFIKCFDEMLNTTLVHRSLRKKVKYKTLIKLELYKIIKHLLEEKKYNPLKVWW
ncbi:MAG: type I-B CRISPR-associated endonuclease Cas1b [Candidatus Omnitrophica bacterium]|nr:type I-B CRISPR-associated endonuclease Cas1b [Candidatus Omnitrophota bacterium]